MTYISSLMKRKSLLLKCIAISLALHVSALIYFYTHPIILHSGWQSLFGLSAATPEQLDFEEDNQDLLEKNSMIKEAFHRVLVLSPHFQQPLDLVELPKSLALSPNDEACSVPVIDIKSEIAWEEPLSDELQESSAPSVFHDHLQVQSLFIPQESPWNFVSQVQIDHEPALSSLSTYALPSDILSQDDVIESDFTAVSDISIEAADETDAAGVNLIDRVAKGSVEKVESITLKTDPHPMLSGIDSIQIPEHAASTSHSYFLSKQTPDAPPVADRAPSSSALPDFDHYQFPTIATATEWNEDFSVDLKFLQKEDDNGYIFSITLNPAFDISQYSLKQNIYFIIDRSNSVQKHRFAVFKRAVLKALASMQNSDAFNIYVIDKKVTKFTSSPLRVNMKAIQAAEEFLDKQDAGTLFAGSDIYASLDKILPEIGSVDEMHTAILLTDGNTLHNSPKQQQVLAKWLDKNSGKLSLYTAAVGQKNNLLMLDMLSTISGGKLLYSDTHASFPRKLAKLILDLKNPVAKDLIIAALPEYEDAHIQFYSASGHLPSLFGNQPYVIYGYIDEPCNFDLVIQGRHGDEWIAIKKTVSFSEGQKGTRQLEKQWKAQQANLCYAKFLREGKTAHLKEAREILKTSRTEIAFE